MRTWDRRRSTLLLLIAAGAALLAVSVAGGLLTEQAMATDFSRRDLAPCWGYPFGTDWMGRDMLARTLAGLSLSIRIGVLTAGISAAVALILGTVCAISGDWADAAVSWVIDLVMGIPHILLIILISIACGRGLWGVTAGVALSHWTSLARVVRGEVLQLHQAPYLRMARKLGVSQGKLLRLHLLPHLLPQLLAGLILQFPHAILHEASVTFLGFRSSPPSGSCWRRAWAIWPWAAGGWPCSRDCPWCWWWPSSPCWESGRGCCCPRPAHKDRKETR